MLHGFGEYLPRRMVGRGPIKHRYPRAAYELLTEWCAAGQLNTQDRIPQPDALASGVTGRNYSP